ncbi:MAG TPA: hypothetical protein VFO25_13745 [Candidatus Eremiobacteraceae bacterium]|nr:hypothetical protein [Candidatus Eremiobacteraceae bacterium]
MRNIYGADGNIAARVDSSGRVSLGFEPSAIVGIVRSDTDVFSGEAGVEWLGRIDSDGRIFDAQHQVVGNVDASGRVLDVTARLVGTVEFAVDGAALLLLVGSLSPDVLRPPPPPEPKRSIMEEAMELAEEDRAPGIRKNYRPLTDDEVFGKPFKKKT